jgi:signal transduction histidine kinase
MLVGGTLIFLLGLLFFPLRSIVLNNVLVQEQRIVETDIQRIVEQLSNQLIEMELLANSYAAWDDTYAFVVEGNPEYIQQNHGYASFFAENRDFVQITDQNGGLLLSKAVDSASGRGIAPPRLPEPAPGSANPLYAHPTIDSSLSGILILRQGPMLFVSAPITDNSREAPIGGTLIFGRFLDQGEIDALSSITGLAFEAYPVDAPNIPAEVRAIMPRLSTPETTVVVALDEERVVGYRLMNDFFGAPALIVQVDVPRTIYSQGKITINYLALVLVIAGAVFALVILLLLERMVLARLERLSYDVERIGASGDTRAQVQMTGDDELSRLATTINEMLAAIDRAQLERQQAAEERLRLQDELILTKHHMISRVSHELRTPLTPIKGFVDLLLIGAEGELNENQRQILKVVLSNADRMAMLVDDLLDLGRVEGEGLRLDISLVELREVVAEATALFRQEIAKKSIQLSYDLAPDLPLIEADSKRMGQVLVNLVSNAVKYTFSGGAIVISAKQLDAEHIELQVADSGVGLTPEQQRQLFTPFYRADSPLHTTTNGTGLGLLIARAIVEEHNGSLYVRSALGQGSTFGITLPIHQAE